MRFFWISMLFVSLPVGASETKTVPDPPIDLTLYEDSYAIIGPDTSNLNDGLVFKFQISSKLKILDTPFYLAYTQNSFMNVKVTSYPFYDHNFRPELLYRKESQHEEPLRWWQIALVHQSNGREEPASRSWNQVAGRLMFYWDGWFVEPHLWIPFSVEQDDFTEYMGFGSLTIGHGFDNDIRVTGWVRPGGSFDKAALRVDLSIPWGSMFSSYRHRTAMGLWIQGFHGYGETMLGYDVRSSSIAIGFGIQRPLDE